MAIGGVSTQIRARLEPGDLFVALKDVARWPSLLAQAFVSGAASALIFDPKKAEGLGLALVVGDVLDGLRKLGEAARDGLKRQARRGDRLCRQDVDERGAGACACPPAGRRIAR